MKKKKRTAVIFTTPSCQWRVKKTAKLLGLKITAVLSKTEFTVRGDYDVLVVAMAKIRYKHPVGYVNGWIKESENHENLGFAT